MKNLISPQLLHILFIYLSISNVVFFYICSYNGGYFISRSGCCILFALSLNNVNWRIVPQNVGSKEH